MVSGVCDGEDMRWHLVTLLAFVEFNDLLRVDWKSLVGVDHHTEQTGICLEGETISAYYLTCTL